MKPEHLALALLANLAWAFNWVAGKFGTQAFPPLMFTGLRFAILLLVLLPWLRPVPGQMTRLLQVASIMGVLHFGLIFAAMAAAEDLSSVAILSQLYAPFSAILAWLILGERLGLARSLGICIAFAGVLVIGFDPVVFNNLDALGLVTGAALALGLATVLMRGMTVGVFTMQAWTALFGVLGMLLLSAIFESNQLEILRTTDWSAFAWPVYSALGASLVGHGSVYFLLTRYPVGMISSAMLLTPVIAVMFGVLFWGDVLTWKLILGGALTMGGVAGVVLAPGRTRVGSPADRMSDS